MRTPWSAEAAPSLHPAASRWIPLWDGREAFGWLWGEMPLFRFKFAPAGLATRRQLRALRLCPGGQEPYAVLLIRRNGRRWAWLYRLDLARPSRTPSPLQLNALDKAMAERRRCRQCGVVQDYCVSVADGRCYECMTGPYVSTDLEHTERAELADSDGSAVAIAAASAIGVVLEDDQLGNGVGECEVAA